MGEVCRDSRSRVLSVSWRVCNLFMCLFFCLATYVQINDPDAGVWMVRETLVWRRVADLHVMVSCAVVSMLGWRLHAEGVTEIFQREEGREFSGLLLTTVWLLMCRHSGRSPVGTLRVSTAVAITVFPFVAWLYYYINRELTSNWPSHCKTAI
ncbi:transmembrane protein 220 isoform X2 [Dicentrarchus labrax]|uniref:transmembrane protein 220 isoform X2 n=1 Tax=Dicentrarchus labrax TaxID=13489 RepID=UPI0021F64ED1|nr:transmembrane protein 220 isoform X2 [Dicentrarchus labrax]